MTSYSFIKPIYIRIDLQENLAYASEKVWTSMKSDVIICEFWCDCSVNLLWILIGLLCKFIVNIDGIVLPKNLVFDFLHFFFNISTLVTSKSSHNFVTVLWLPLWLLQTVAHISFVTVNKSHNFWIWLFVMTFMTEKDSYNVNICDCQ